MCSKTSADKRRLPEYLLSENLICAQSSLSFYGSFAPSVPQRMCVRAFLIKRVLLFSVRALIYYAEKYRAVICFNVLI